jgi:hypothetical protein
VGLKVIDGHYIPEMKLLLILFDYHTIEILRKSIDHMRHEPAYVIKIYFKVDLRYYLDRETFGLGAMMFEEYAQQGCDSLEDYFRIKDR